MKRVSASIVMIAALALPAPAQTADGPAAAFSVAARETFDIWDNVAGGVRSDALLLNKLQLSASASAPFGLPGLSVHAQLLRTDGRSLSARVGDIQTVSNIEAVPATRLFESWVEQRFGDKDDFLAVRVGLLDLNADFDSITTSALLINSAHGIGTDLARSGANGPSIFPVSAAGLRLSWLPSPKWTFRLAAFDGVPGDPDRPKAFAAVHLRHSDGALLIAQGDYNLSDAAKIEAGAWRYTARRAPVAGFVPHHDGGAYASIESPIPGQDIWSGWLRAGFARGQIVSSYLGVGVVAKGLLHRRPDDRLGLGLARAGISGAARAALGLPRAETTIETSYQMRMSDRFAVQPDLQYVRHPAGIARADDALVAGLRLILTEGYPRHASATDPTDPTVPPEGPQFGDPSLK